MQVWVFLLVHVSAYVYVSVCALWGPVYVCVCVCCI